MPGLLEWPVTGTQCFSASSWKGYKRMLERIDNLIICCYLQASAAVCSIQGPFDDAACHLLARKRAREQSRALH